MNSNLQITHLIKFYSICNSGTMTYLVIQFEANSRHMPGVLYHDRIELMPIANVRACRRAKASRDRITPADFITQGAA